MKPVDVVINIHNTATLIDSIKSILLIFIVTTGKLIGDWDREGSG